jgi:hypothetical protein
MGMLHIEKKHRLVQIGARIPKDTRKQLRDLADSLSTSETKVTEGEVVRQIITDFFSSDRTRNVNGNHQSAG